MVRPIPKHENAGTEVARSRRQFLLASAALLGGLPAAAFCGEEAPRVPTTDEELRKLAEEAPLALTFRGKTAEECRQWQKEFAAKLRVLLGPHQPPAKWNTDVERTVELKDHRREELVLKAEGQPPLPVYLLLPRDRASRPCPGVLALHGHGKFGYDSVAGRDDRPEVAEEIHQNNYDYGRQLVRQGYVVAVPCLTPFGRRLGDRTLYRGQDPCGDTFIRMQLLGKLLIAENLRDCLWAVELLAAREEVDRQRLGCVGLSYGGRMAMLTSALEPRIRVAVISGALNVMQERIRQPYSCGAQIIPGLLKYGDVPEIGSLIAPRHCLWEVGSRDSLISPRWADAALGRMRRAYQALQVEDRLLVDRFDGGHVWNGRVAYPLLKKVLS
jgi:dienelactone hydrolase